MEMKRLIEFAYTGMFSLRQNTVYMYSEQYNRDRRKTKYIYTCMYLYMYFNLIHKRCNSFEYLKDHIIFELQRKI